MSEYAITLADVEEAAARIAPFIRHTPLMTSASVDRAAGRADLPEVREPAEGGGLQVPRRHQRGAEARRRDGQPGAW